MKYKAVKQIKNTIKLQFNLSIKLETKTPFTIDVHILIYYNLLPRTLSIINNKDMKDK